MSILIPRLGGSDWLFGEDQFALASLSQAVDLALILDPNLVTAACQGIELDNLGERAEGQFFSGGIRL